MISALQKHELLVATQHLDALSARITGIQTDHRLLKAGEIFVCIKGESFDGHSVIAAALDRGAALIVCQQKPEANFPAIWVSDTRKAAALLARIVLLPEELPYKLIGITGTNGKTTTSLIIYQALRSMGFACGWIGTLGYYILDEHFQTAHTTPDIIQLNSIFAKMAESGCRYIVMEVSSHALSLDRVFGVHFDYCLFSNLSRDHLDFHGDMKSYALAKYQFFATAIENNAVSIINRDDSFGREILCNLQHSNAKCFSVGHSDADYLICEAQSTVQGSRFQLLLDGLGYREQIEHPLLPSTSNLESAQSSPNNLPGDHLGNSEDISAIKTARSLQEGYKLSIDSSLIGAFNIQNLALMAATLHQMGFSAKEVEQAASKVKSVKGRLQGIPNTKGIGVFVDYAHTPDAIENLLRSVSELPHGRILTLIGAGGDRDKGKRPLMLRAALNYSDVVIVSDDNPRTENPDAIIRDIVANCDLNLPWWIIRERTLAIRSIVSLACPGDIVLLCGKGHEDYQEIEGKRHHFSDAEQASLALQETFDKADNELLLPVDDTLLQLLFNSGWEPQAKGYRSPLSYRHLSTDSRSIKPGSLFIALKGENFDGHNFVLDVLADVSNAVICQKAEESERIYLVEDSLKAMSLLCAKYLQLFKAKRIALTGSTGKTTTKEFIAAVLGEKAPTLKTLANENNLIGVCKTILRILPEHEFAVFELGTNHFGEIAQMADTVKADYAIITNIGPSHLEFFGDEEGVFKEKSELFHRPLALKFYPGDDERFDSFARTGLSVGYGETCHYKISEQRIEAGKQSFTIMNRSWSIPFDTPYYAINAAFAISLALELGLDYPAIQAGLQQPLELGMRMKGEWHNGRLLLVDCYNANPWSMQKALEYWQAQAPEKEHVAILGDMLELGESATMFHQMISAMLSEMKFDQLYCVGPLARQYQTDTEAFQKHYQDSDELLNSGDLAQLPKEAVVLIKASHGVHLEKIIPVLRGES